MVRTVDLDDKSGREADEVDDVRAETILPAKAQMADAFAAQLVPQEPFSSGLVLAQELDVQIGHGVGNRLVAVSPYPSPTPSREGRGDSVERASSDMCAYGSPLRVCPGTSGHTLQGGGYVSLVAITGHPSRIRDVCTRRAASQQDGGTARQVLVMEDRHPDAVLDLRAVALDEREHLGRQHAPKLPHPFA